MPAALRPVHLWSAVVLVLAIATAAVLFAARGDMRESAVADIPDSVQPPSGAPMLPRREGGELEPAPGTEPEPIRWRRSRALGTSTAGRLVRGTQLPSEGELFFTWDPIEKVSPNRSWRRYATDRLLRTVLGVLADFHAANPDAPRIGIGDLSRRHGGDFGVRFGAPGHASHQNGLDADIYYPRSDRLERAPLRPRQIDRRLAQDLVDRFVRAGAQYVFVGPATGLKGPRRIVQPLVHHDNHLHVRLPRR